MTRERPTTLTYAKSRRRAHRAARSLVLSHLIRQGPWRCEPFDEQRPELLVARIKGKSAGIKCVLLDQTVVSGIGNIYADEALWPAKVHGETAASSLSKARISALIDAARDVMAAALAQGGTSFDSLYVDVAGSSGYFERSLHAYGREGEPSDRCGTPIVRRQFMNRSSHFCPRCQRKR